MLIDPFKFHDFLLTRMPWGLARLYYVIPAKVSRGLRRFRFKQPPRGGWGKGWRVLIFRQTPSGHELHVLAPVSGLDFDYDLLRQQVRGEVKPQHRHRDGVRSAEMAWSGHHIYVVNDEIGAQRIPMGKLIPGEFHGGVLDVGLTLMDVRQP